MEDKINPVALGAFVLVLGSALVLGVLWLAAGVSGKKDYVRYQSVVAESVAGLSTNAPVKYLGVDVGKVDSIAIDPGNSQQVLIGFLIERGTPIKQDSAAVLKTQGLTGIAYVELSGGSAGAAALVPTEATPVPRIASKPSLSTRLENVLGTVLAGVDRLTGSVNALLDVDNRAALKQVLADAAVVSRALASQEAALRSGLADAARTTHSTAQASEQLTPLLARITASAQALERMADTAALASTQAGAAASGAATAASGVATAATDGLKQLRSDTLPELGRLMLELDALAKSLRTLSEQTARQPSSLLLGGPTRPPGPGESTAP